MVPPWHSRCDDEECYYRCARPDCGRPDSHFLSRFDRKTHTYVHRDACDAPVSLAQEVLQELHPGISAEELAIGRRVLEAAVEELNALRARERQRRMGGAEG
jgi:hypothetical protein